MQKLICASNSQLSKGQLQSDPRLAAIRELLVPIWDTLDFTVRCKVLNELSKTSRKMTETLRQNLEGNPSSQFKIFCDDREVRSFL